jgi:hypothetical protein
MRVARLRSLLPALTLLLPLAAAAQQDRYFPQTGPGAIHQRATDLSSGAVVLFVALQPGYEDFPMLAQLRMGAGAQVIVLFVTNGDATPGDAGGTAPVFVAAGRKEESSRVSAYLGLTSTYLNVPDPGVCSDRALLERIWSADTVRARLEHAFRYYRPDVVVVGGDRREGASVRQSLLEECVWKAAEDASAPPAVTDSSHLAEWRVRRLYVESGSGQKNRGRSAIHPVWKKSYRTIGEEASLLYGSLRFQIGAWHADRSYALIPSRRADASFLKGLPVLGTYARGFRPVIDRVVRPGKGGVRTPTLDRVARAIDSLDTILGGRRRDFSPGDLRVLAWWKNTLEALRCSLLDVRIEYAVDESLVTRNQVAFLRFGSVSLGDDSAHTRIFFPGAVKHTWGINQSLDHQFPFSSGRSYMLITPREMEYSFPLSQFGIRQNTLWTRFSFMVIHRDPRHRNDYVYRGEMPFRGGPRRTLEVLTPVVRALDGEPVVVRLINLSRDPYQGKLLLADSLALPFQKEIILPSRGFVLTDTVRLKLRERLPEGDHPMKLDVTGGGELPFVARSFSAEPDTAARVGLLTSLLESPLESAMERLRISRVDLGNGEELPGLDRCNVLLLERDAFSEGRALPWRRIHAWVRRGGHLVVLSPGPRVRASVLPDLGFAPAPALSPWADVRADSTSAILTTPNAISSADWNGWVVARSWGPLQLGGGARVVASSGDLPLLAVEKEGEGRVSVVALDLGSQLMNLHAGAHRLLANILRP